MPEHSTLTTLIVRLRNKNFSQPALLLAYRLDRFCNGNFRKSHLVARPQLADAMDIGRDHIRDLGISTGGLLIDKENDRLAILRHLNSPERDAIRKQFGLFARAHGLSLQPQTPAVRLLADDVRAGEQFLECLRPEPILLRAFGHTQRSRSAQRVKGTRTQRADAERAVLPNLQHVAALQSAPLEPSKVGSDKR